MTTKEKQNKISMGNFFKSYKFDQEISQVGGTVIAHHGKLHAMGGYDFKEMITKKYKEDVKEVNDSKQGQHFSFFVDENGKGIFKHSEIPYIRFIGMTCMYAHEYETAYIFGGMSEEMEGSVESVVFTSSIIVQNFGTNEEKPETTILPNGVYLPLGRSFHAATWDEDHHQMWIFGGGKMVGSKTPLFNDLWCWSSITSTWTLVKTEGTPAKRWGSSMAYLRGKLYLFGGSPEKGNAKNNKIYVLDLNGKATPRWHSVSLSQSHSVHGTTMTVVNIPGVGDRIIICGGQDNSVNKDLTFNGSINISLDPKNLRNLAITIFSPDQEISDKYEISGVPNVAYHSATMMNGFLYLVGGLNQSGKEVSFADRVIKIDIVGLIHRLYQNSEGQEIKVVETKKYESYTEISKTKEELHQLPLMVQEFFSRDEEKDNPLVKVFLQDQRKPTPLSDFSIIANNSDQKVTFKLNGISTTTSSVFIRNEVLSRRFEKLPKELFKLSTYSAFDLAMYTYSGIIDPETSIYSDFEDFKRLFKLCLKLKFYRLIWLEISIHAPHIKPTEILSLCATSDPNIKCPAIENRNLILLKYVFYETLRVNFNYITADELESIENIEHVSKYMIDFISGDMPEMKFHFSIPGNTVFHDLADVFQDEIIEYNGEKSAFFSKYIEFEDKSIFGNFSREVVEAVIQCSIQIMLIKLSDKEESIKNIIQSIMLINQMKNVSISFLSHFYQPQIAEIRTLINSSSEERNKVLSILSTIKHESLFGFLIHLLGANGAIEVITKDNVAILCREEYLPSIEQQQVYVKTNSKMMYAILSLAYIGKDCKLSMLPPFVQNDKLADAVMCVANQKPCIIPDYVIDIVRPMIVRKLSSKEGKFTTAEIVKNFRGAVQLGILGIMIEKAESSDWIRVIESDFRKDLDEKELRALLKARFNQPI